MQRISAVAYVSRLCETLRDMPISERRWVSADDAAKQFDIGQWRIDVKGSDGNCAADNGR